MVTAEEVGAVTVFASLEEDARDRLSRVSADIALATGRSSQSWRAGSSR